MSAKRLGFWGALVALSAPFVLRGQERPLTATGTFSTGYYSAVTRGDANQSLRFVPLGAKWDVEGYLVSPDLFSFSAQPEMTLGPQASDAGFQGGDGVTLRVMLLRHRVMPLTLRYSNVQLEDAYFGSLSQVSGYTLKSRTKDLGASWELKPKSLPVTTVDWGRGSVDATSGTAGVSDFLSHGDHMNVDSKYEKGGWDLQGFVRRYRQASDVQAPTDIGTREGSLLQRGVQYQASGRRGFLGDSELYVDAGSQSMSSLLFTLPVALRTRYAAANVRFFQRRRWKASARANYSSNLASQLLQQAVGTLGLPGAIVPDETALAPFSRGLAILNLSGATSLAVGHGLELFSAVERSALLSSNQEGMRNSRYLTASAGANYAARFAGGRLSGEYARDYGVGSLTGQSGTIQGQHYMVSSQYGSPDSLEFDATVRGSNQRVKTAQPLTNDNFSGEGSFGRRVAGGFSARLGGGWQWATVTNAANEFRLNGYTARAGIEHPRFQLSGSLNNSLGNSLPFYSQLLGGSNLESALLFPPQVMLSDYRAMSFTLHANPLRRLELSVVWTRSRQHLDGLLSNNFGLLNAHVTYRFRKIQLEAGYIRSNQTFVFYPYTIRERLYLRLSRSARLL